MIPIVPLKTRISKSSSAPVSKRGVLGVEGNSSAFFSLGDDIFGGVKMALPRVAARILLICCTISSLFSIQYYGIED
jgi:hypothetical protein